MSLITDNQSSTIQQLLQSAIQYHQHGDLQQAEKLYGEVLQHNPEQPRVLNLLGILASQTIRYELAESLFRKAIAIKSDVPEYYNNLALVLNTCGRHDEARECFCKALEQNPDYSDAHYNYGNMLLKSGQYTSAIDHYRKALQLKSAYIDAYNNLGQALCKIGNNAQAEDAYRKALELQPGFAVARCNLGQMYQAMGRLEDAVSVFKETIRLTPDYAAAYASLAYARTCASKDDALIVDINYLLEHGNYNAEDSIHLFFALGKLYDDCGQYDLAFPCFKKANDLKCRNINFIQNKLQQEIDNIINVFSKEFIEKYRHYGNSSRRPVFVIGLPRSGTSLVEQIIASHPLAKGMGELDFFNEQMGVIQGHHMQRLLFWSEAKQKTFDEVAADYLKILPAEGNEDIERFVDKMPYNFLHLGLIKTVIPNAYIIHCKRDPLDTCFSIYCNDFEGRHEYTNQLSDIGFYYTHYRRLMTHWYNVLPGSIMDVDYEYLVSEPEQASKKIIEFIDLQWNEKCLEFYNTNRTVYTRSNVQVRQPIYKSSMKRWKHYENYLGALIQSLGEYAQQT